MKHDSLITVLLLVFFVLSQVYGLFLVQHEVQPTVIVEDNQTVVSFNDSIIGDIPTYVFGWKAILYLAVGITVGTLAILLFRKLKFGANLWKIWYFLAVVVSIHLGLQVIFAMLGMEQTLASVIAFVVAVGLGLLKLYHRTFITHNATELLMYSGISVFLVLIFNNNIMVASAVLILISLYDMYAVWKSKHMVKLAKFTADTNLFPGLVIDYSIGSKKEKTKLLKTKDAAKLSAKTGKQGRGAKKAILGGGDIIFPLLFAGVVMGSLVNDGLSRGVAFLFVMIITVATTIALGLLFALGKKDKFYPAMPFISAGCFIGYGLMMLVMYLF